MGLNDLPALEEFVGDTLELLGSREALSQGFVYIGVFFLLMLLFTLYTQLANGANLYFLGSTEAISRSLNSAPVQNLRPLLDHLAARVETAVEKWTVEHFPNLAEK